MDNGWIKLHRKICDNYLWTLEPFTKAQAWIDLILNANHKDNKMSVRGCIVDIKRGQIGWSELTMVKRWKWSRNKVRMFLKRLEKDIQIVQQKSHVTSIITILCYDDYQSQGTTEGTTESTTESTTERQQKDNRRYTNKNVKNVKNVKKEVLSPLQSLWNHHCNNLHKVLRTSKDRQSKERLRLNERHIDEWPEIFTMINNSKFCCGGNDQTWKASYDWIIKNDQNYVKVLEGNYTNGKLTYTPEVPNFMEEIEKDLEKCRNDKRKTV